MAAFTRIVGWGFGLAMCGFLLLPIILMVPVSFTTVEYLTFPPVGFSTRWFEVILSRPAWTSSWLTSLQVGVLSTLIALAAGLPAAVVLVRSRLKFKPLLYTVLLLPQIVPGVVLALGMFFVFVGLGLVGTVPGIALGQSIVLLPLVVFILAAALQGVDVRLEHAAVSLGAHPLRAFFGITLRIISPALLAAALFAFLSSFDEVLISLYLVGPNAVTLSVTIWRAVILEVEPTIAAVSTLIIGLTLVAAGLATWLRRVGRGSPS